MVRPRYNEAELEGTLMELCKAQDPEGSGKLDVAAFKACLAHSDVGLLKKEIKAVMAQARERVVFVFSGGVVFESSFVSDSHTRCFVRGSAFRRSLHHPWRESDDHRFR